MTTRPRSAPPGASLLATLTDRWLVVRAVGMGIYVAGATLAAALVAGGLAGVPLGRVLLYAGVGGVGSGTLATIVALLGSHTAGRGFAAFLAPSGSSTPAVEGFSDLEAMAMRGQVADALQSFESRIAAAPDDVATRLAAADMYASRGGNAARAAELFREARALPAITVRDEIYATNRLVDLYLGPLDTPGRALVELRRLADRFPTSETGRRAREAIASLKRSEPNG